MVYITPGETFSDPAITPTKLNNLMDLAGTYTLGPAALTSGADYFLLAQPGSPGEGDVVVDSTTGLFQHYDGSTWSFDRVEPLEVVMTNRSGMGMTAGDVVLADPANDLSFIQSDGTTSKIINVVGVLKANVADAATVSVYVRGVCDALVVGNSVSLAGNWIQGPAVLSSAAIPINPSSPVLGGAEFFGMLLEDVPSGTTTLAKVLLWR